MLIANAPTNTTIEIPAYIMALIDAIAVMLFLHPENFLCVLTSGHELSRAYTNARTIPLYSHSTVIRKAVKYWIIFMTNK